MVRQRNSHSSKANLWQSELRLITNRMEIRLVICSKKEKQLWLAEFSRAISWADGASPVKAIRNRKFKSLGKANPANPDIVKVNQDQKVDSLLE